MSATLHNVTITNEVNVGWGRAAWGQEPWNENTTFPNSNTYRNFGMSATIGTVTTTEEINKVGADMVGVKETGVT